MHRCVIGIFFILLTGVTQAQTAVPHTFVAGTPAQAAQVNANFQALVTAVNNSNATIAQLVSRVTTLEDQVSTLNDRVEELEQGGVQDAFALAGSYNVSGLKSALWHSGGQVAIEMLNWGGVITLTATSPAGGTFSWVQAGQSFAKFWQVNLATPPGLTVTSNTESIADNASGTWTLNNGVITMNFGALAVPTYYVANGQMLVLSNGDGNANNNVWGNNNLIIAVRQR